MVLDDPELLESDFTEGFVSFLVSAGFSELDSVFGLSPAGDFPL